MRNGRRARMLEEVLPQSMGGRTRPEGHPRVFSIAGSKTPFRLVLVRALPGVASHLKVEKPCPAVAEAEADLTRAGVSSRGAETHPMTARNAADQDLCGNLIVGGR